MSAYVSTIENGVKCQEYVPIVVVAQTFTIGTDFVYCSHSWEIHQMQSYTDPCTYALQYDAFLLELMNDAPGEIYDVDEEEKFNVESYINGDTDFWGK